MRQIVTSEDIDRLFHPTKRDAQEMLAHVIRRLILLSSLGTDLKFLSMAAGDDIRAHGWDGELEYSGVSPFIPQGQSRWEVGVSEDPKAKANSDYSTSLVTGGGDVGRGKDGSWPAECKTPIGVFRSSSEVCAPGERCLGTVRC